MRARKPCSLLRGIRFGWIDPRQEEVESPAASRRPSLSVAGAAVVGRQRAVQVPLERRELLAEVVGAEEDTDRRPEELLRLEIAPPQISRDLPSRGRDDLRQTQRPGPRAGQRVEEALLTDQRQHRQRRYPLRRLRRLTAAHVIL